MRGSVGADICAGLQPGGGAGARRGERRAGATGFWGCGNTLGQWAIRTCGGGDDDVRIDGHGESVSEMHIGGKSKR